MGMTQINAIATTVVVDCHDFLWKIPNEWTMEEGSTVPAVYATSYYALIVRAKLRRGENVLIHSGSGGVGQAAIAICMSLDCRVFTTVGSEHKKQFLMKQFPQLMSEDILSSRNTLFENYIMQQTNNSGVDIVLNSLSDDKLQASVRCLAVNGRFCEIGKYDLNKDTIIGMK